MTECGGESVRVFNHGGSILGCVLPGMMYILLSIIISYAFGVTSVINIIFVLNIVKNICEIIFIYVTTVIVLIIIFSVVNVLNFEKVSSVISV